MPLHTCTCEMLNGAHMIDELVNVSEWHASLPSLQHLKAQRQLHKKFAFQILIELKKQLTLLPSLVDVPVRGLCCCCV